MQCPQCQFENVDGAKFCNECGSKLEVSCSKCGKSNPPGSKFCNDCGNELEELQAAASVDYSKPQSYTPKFLADKILTFRNSIEGEHKLVTVLFADVANYTSMSEKLDPEEVHQIMDGCFKILMDEIHKYEGTINQFTGDGVMSLFGAPVAHEDHAQRACYAALSIQNAVEEYGDKVKKDCGVDFKMRIGLNSGPVIVGSIGDDLRMDYTAVGDKTNVAARMESMAKPGTIFVSRHTHRLARDFFEFETLGKVEVKGKEELQEAFELLKTGKVETRIGASAAKGLTHFVGRKTSMEALMEAYDKAESGSGQIMGIVGEAGVGKSRLILEFKNRLPQDAFTYLEGRCLHYGGSIVYLPILDILRSYFEIKEEDREYPIKKRVEERVSRLDENLIESLPPLQDILSLKVEDGAYIKLDPKKKREMAFDAIRDLFIRESQNRPLVLAVEDLHWIDKTSEEFLDYLIGWMAGARILLILLYRPEYTHPWGSKSYYNRIGLDQLTTKSSAELVQAILEGAEVAPELRELILNRAAGNPLFMEEFTHTLLENGSIQRQDNQYVLRKKASDIQVPDTIQGIITARIDRLEDNLKRTMQVASVVGRDFAFQILQTITGMREELKSNLLNLQGLEFIYEKRLFPELEYVFKHALTQEVAYNSLLQKRRKEIHEKIGRAIEEIYPDRLEEFYEMLAYHYSKSENAEKAYQYLKLSGNKATKNYSNSEAMRFYKEALDVLTSIPDTEENKKGQIEVRLLIAAPMLNLGFPEDSLEILQEGGKFSRELGDKKSLVHFLSLIGQYYAWKGEDLFLSIQYSEDSFKEAEKIEDVELMAPVGADLSVLYFLMGEYVKVTDIASKVIALLEKSQRQAEFFGRPYNVYSCLLAQQSTCNWRMGNFEEGEVLFEKGFDFALKIKDLFSLGLMEIHHGWDFNFKGDAKTAIEHFENSLRYCEEGQIVSYVNVAWMGLGWAYWLMGELETARKYMEKGLNIQIDAGVRHYWGFWYGLLGTVYLDSGDLIKAQHHGKEALKISQKNHEKAGEGFAWILLGRTLGKADLPQTNTAEESFFKGIKIYEELKIITLSVLGYFFLGEMYANTGQKDKALETLKTAGSLFQEMEMDYWLARTYALYAGLFQKEGELSKAKDTLAKAIEIFKECGADGWVDKYEKELTASL
jgi:class 3 adenylate cyclase/tetratricopeptide (TPR) repeat protein